MKICSICKIEKSLSEFNWKNKKKKLKSSRCKLCQNGMSKEHYEKNKLSYELTVKKKRTKNLQIMYDYLKTHPCIDCGEKDPIVLDFDHINPDEKSFDICKGKYSVGVEKFVLEMEKCEIRCANCHRRKTALENNWYKNIIK